MYTFILAWPFYLTCFLYLKYTWHTILAYIILYTLCISGIQNWINCKSSSYILNTSHSSDIYVENIFFLNMNGLTYHFFILSFQEQNFKFWWKSDLLALMFCVFCVFFLQKLCRPQDYKHFLLCFLLEVLCYTLRYMIHFESILCIKCEVRVIIFPVSFV